METEKTILCIDDDQDTCELLTFVFQNSGFQVVGCDTPEEGIRYARTNKYAAIITNSYYEGMDGADFCRVIRASDGEIPIVFFCTEAREDKKQAAVEAGAQAYFIKPADFEEVAQTVIRLINKGENK